MPRVSIIIPIYNVMEYLPRTVASVREQTERDIEIILVDDGSTDESGAMCDAFAQEDDRIRVIHKENGGLSSARNAGVNVARSEYVLLLDGDDRLHREAVARALEIARETGADFVQFRYREVAADERSTQPIHSGPAVLGRGPAELFANLYHLGGEGASACTKLFRRELLERIPFEAVRHEDEMWCTRAFAERLTAAYIDDVLYDYVMRDGSIIRGGFNPSRLDTFRVCSERIKTLKQLRLTELLGQEYGKLFLAILTICRDAADAGDKQSVSAVKTAFLQHKDGIKIYAKPGGKFGILFWLMCVRFEAVQIYRVYWKIRRSDL